MGAFANWYARMSVPSELRQKLQDPADYSKELPLAEVVAEIEANPSRFRGEVDLAVSTAREFASDGTLSLKSVYLRQQRFEQEAQRGYDNSLKEWVPTQRYAQILVRSAVLGRLPRVGGSLSD